MEFLHLWMPVIVSAIAIWFVSAIIWMVMPWHKTDFRKLPNEEGARAALKGTEPGYYMLPYCMDPKEAEDPAKQQMFIDGPVGYVTMAPNGLMTMGAKLIRTMIYYIVVGFICAYMLTATGGVGGDYLHIFQVTGTVAFVAYGMAFVQDSIWFSRPWSITAKTFLDALIYALVTGGVFGWLAAGG